jgi:hypothetical protein
MTNEATKRTVIILKREWDRETRKQLIIPIGEATFICFSIDHEEYEDGIGNYPVALVEHDDGRVEAVDIKCMRFKQEEVKWKTIK